MRRRIVGVVVALLLASAGTLTLVAWAAAAEDRALAGERTVDVFVVRQAIASGTGVDGLRDSVELEQVPAKVSAEGSVADLSELDGKVAAVDLVPGEQLVAGRFADPEVLARQTMVEVPDGLQEVTISLEPQRAVGGNLRPGDTVGLVASFDPFEDVAGGDAKTPNTTHMILHKVLVTRVQAAVTAAAPRREEGDEGPDPTPGSDLLITLAVDAPSVERIVFAQEFGFVWLTAEPETATEDGTTIQTRGTIYR